MEGACCGVHVWIHAVSCQSPVVCTSTDLQDNDSNVKAGLEMAWGQKLEIGMGRLQESM